MTSEIKLLKVFGGKPVVVRTSSYAISPDGNEGVLIYEGFLMDLDEKYAYLSPTPYHDTISSAVQLDTIEEISILEAIAEEPPKQGKVFSLIKGDKEDEPPTS